MMPLKPATNRAEDRRPAAGRAPTEETRRDAWAARMASLVLGILVVYWLITSLHMFTKLL
jgi:hypothetical protein